MSGVSRALVSELANKGLTGEKAMSYLQPKEYREENGRSMASGADDAYLGKNAPKKVN